MRVCVYMCVGCLTDFRLWMGLNNSKQTDNNSLHPRTYIHTHICTYLQLCFRGFNVNICASGWLPSKSMSVNCCGLWRIIIFAIVRQWLTNVQTHLHTQKHTCTHAHVFALKRSRRASRHNKHPLVLLLLLPPMHPYLNHLCALFRICRALHMLRDYVMARHLISNRRRITTKSAQQKHQRLEM